MKFIKINKIGFLIISLLFLGNTLKLKKFPPFEYQTTSFGIVNNSIFTCCNSIVVIGHIGCPPLMQFIKDSQESELDDSYQIIFILENTNSQISSFNIEENNIWSHTRKAFGIKPLENIIIGECSNEIIKYQGENVIIAPQCRIIAKKLKTKSSPSFYFIDKNGMIQNSKMGYHTGASAEDRLKMLFNIQ